MNKFVTMILTILVMGIVLAIALPPFAAILMRLHSLLSKKRLSPLTLYDRWIDYCVEWGQR